MKGLPRKRWLDRVWPAVAPERLVRALLTSRARPRGGGGRACSTQPSSDCSLARAPASAGATADVALVDEAHALVARAAALVRPRDRRRGPGPDADAAAHGRPSRGRRLADDPRRHRAGDGAGRPYRAGATCSSGCPPARTPDVAELPPCLPRPGGDHGPRAAAARQIAPDVAPPVAFRPGGAPPRVERVEPGELVGAALQAALELAREDGLLAVILPDALVPEFETASAYEDGIPLLSPRAGEGPRVRPRGRRRAGADRRGRDRSAGALRRADAADADARRRARAAAAEPMRRDARAR